MEEITYTTLYCCLGQSSPMFKQWLNGVKSRDGMLALGNSAVLLYSDSETRCLAYK